MMDPGFPDLQVPYFKAVFFIIYGNFTLMPQNKTDRFHLLLNFRNYSQLLQDGNKFCAFDTETTGLKSSSERIIELGAVKFDKDGIIDTFGTLINPQIPVPPAATEINHITDSMLEGKPTEDQVIPKFKEFSKGTILIAHNAQFDIRFINASLERLGYSPLDNQAVDTLRFSRWALPENQHWTQVFLAEQLKIKIETAHRAQDDARVCMELFLKLVELTKNYPKNWARICKNIAKSKEIPR